MAKTTSRVAPQANSLRKLLPLDWKTKLRPVDRNWRIKTATTTPMMRPAPPEAEMPPRTGDQDREKNVGGTKIYVGGVGYPEID